MLVIGWEYLRQQAVASFPGDYARVEWPPHPDRVFQALVASWGERGCDPTERKALEWLEGLGAPWLAVPPPADRAHYGGPQRDVAIPPHTTPRAFVPVNDPGGVKAFSAKNADLRHRKARNFPKIWVEAPCALIWPEVEVATLRRKLAPLQSIAQGVTYLGHSHSLVRMWVQEEAWTTAPTYRPARPLENPDVHLRVSPPGRLAQLVRAYAQGGEAWQRPPMAPWHGYVGPLVRREESIRGIGAGPVVVLARVRGQGNAVLTDTLALTQALRSSLLRHAKGGALDLLSGHAPDGSPLKRPHVAYLPLAFVGHRHAAGHVLGMALVLPTDATGDDVLQIRLAVASALDPDRRTLRLYWGEGRTLALTPDLPDVLPTALMVGTWARRSRVWASVTPVVLDRHPTRKEARVLRRAGDYDAFAAREVARACERVGLPLPAEVRILAVSPLGGVPHVRRFPPLEDKSGRSRRQVHVWVRFPVEIKGPVVLGAGRYRGYGLLRPIDGA